MKDQMDATNAKVLYAQEEINHILRNRLARVKGHYEREFQFKLLQIEVLGKLKKENIPTIFAQFLITSKNEKKIRANLESFVKTWHECQINQR